MAGGLKVRAGRMVRLAGTESRTRQGSKPGGLEKGEKAKQESGKTAGRFGHTI